MDKSCCFFGHRKIKTTETLTQDLRKAIRGLIEDASVENFYFGSKSQFDDLCHSVVTEFKIEYPHIKRIYVRAEFASINDDYEKYLLESFEETYYPEHMVAAGKAAYVERNYEMIEKKRLLYCLLR